MLPNSWIVMETMRDNVQLNCVQNRVSEATTNSLTSVQTIVVDANFSQCLVAQSLPSLHS